MAKKSMILKQQRPAKFSTRRYNRCKICGRPHAYLRDYGICRMLELASEGGVLAVIHRERRSLYLNTSLRAHRLTKISQEASVLVYIASEEFHEARASRQRKPKLKYVTAGPRPA